jgi:hypothetical protein
VSVEAAAASIFECPLENFAFKPNCKLTQVEISSFSESPAVKSICIPGSIQLISRYFFEKCTSLSNVTFKQPSSLRQLESGVVSLRNFLTVDHVNRHQFASLVDVTFEPNWISTRIDNEAFRRCTSLKSIWIPTSVQTLSRMSFHSCITLVDATFEPDLKLGILKSINIIRSFVRLRCEFSQAIQGGAGDAEISQRIDSWQIISPYC